MNNSIYRFTLDIHKTKSQVSIPVLFRDTGIQFYISLTDGGKPYFIEDGCRAVFSAKKADGNSLLNDCIIEDNTRIRYDFTAQTTNCEGMMNCEIRLYGRDGKLITTPAFVVIVDPRVNYDSDIIESYPESTTLENIIYSELSRVEAETQRVNAEAARVVVENERDTDEAARADAEAARIAAESERVDAEKVRLANERERVAAYAHMLGSWVAYSAYPDGTDYTFLWSEGQRYIGICNGKTPPQDKTGFVWSKFVDTGIYIGSGEMPTWCNFQIDPDGEVTEVVQEGGTSPFNVMSQKASSTSFANALKGSESGEMIALGDVSPVTHEMGVKVWGKNLLNSSLRITPKTDNGLTVQYLPDEDCYLLNGTTTRTANCYRVSEDLLIDGKVTASVKVLSGSIDNPNSGYTRFQLGGRDDLNASVSNWSDALLEQSGSRTSSAAKKYLSATWFYIDGGITFTNYKVQIQIERGTTATAYTPYIEDISAVSLIRCGKNVAKKQAYSARAIYPPTETSTIVPTNNYGTIISTTEPVNVLEVTQTPNTAYGAQEYQNGYICVGLQSDLMAGKKYYVEFDAEIKSNPFDADYFYLIENNNKYYNNVKNTTAFEVGKKYHVVTPIEWVKREDRQEERNIIIRCMGMSFTLSNFMITAEGVDGDFEEYTEQECPVNADGTVEGVTSHYPITTLLTDTAGAVMDVTYNRDANKALSDIVTRIAALESAVLN